MHSSAPTLVSMRQENHNATLSDPLGLSTTDELIKDALCIVGKVPKLGFPADQRIWIGHRVAELKAQYSKLRKRAVADNVLSLVIREAIQLVVCHLKEENIRVTDLNMKEDQDTDHTGISMIEDTGHWY